MIEVTRACIVAFMKARCFLVNVERRKKTADDENVLCKALAKNFLLTSKGCLWPTFYEMDFNRR